jgi:hypothetical protein
MSALEITTVMVPYTSDVILVGMVAVPIALELVVDSDFDAKKMIKNKINFIIK